MRRDIEGSELIDTIMKSGAIGARIQGVSLVLAGTLTMAAGQPPVNVLDCNGSARTVLLPPEAKDLFLVIFNISGTAVAITVKEDSNTTTIGTINQSKAALLYCDGTTWRILNGA